jgi:hypothetical protein
MCAHFRQETKVFVGPEVPGGGDHPAVVRVHGEVVDGAFGADGPVGDFAGAGAGAFGGVFGEVAGQRPVADLAVVSFDLCGAGRMARTSTWEPQVKVCSVVWPSMVGVWVTVAVSAAARTACSSRVASAQAGAGSSGPSGPSSPITAWKWINPRFWYSATLA